MFPTTPPPCTQLPGRFLGRRRHPQKHHWCAPRSPSSRCVTVRFSERPNEMGLVQNMATLSMKQGRIRRILRLWRMLLGYRTSCSCPADPRWQFAEVLSRRTRRTTRRPVRRRSSRSATCLSSSLCSACRTGLRRQHLAIIARPNQRSPGPREWAPAVPLGSVRERGGFGPSVRENSNSASRTWSSLNCTVGLALA